MKRRLSYVPGVVFFGGMAVFSVFQGRAVHAVVLGVLALLLVWFAFRPEPEPNPARLLRTMVIGAVAVSLVALGLVAAAVTEGDQTAAGLAVVAASISVPFAAFLWWLVYVGWKKGYRWAGSSVAAEVSDTERSEPSV